MSGARQGWQGTVTVPTAVISEHPNKQTDAVSAHIRVYWPWGATDEEVIGAMHAAFQQAVDGVTKLRAQ